MNFNLKIWHVVTFFSVLIISGCIYLGIWVSANNSKIRELNKSIKGYDTEIKRLQGAYKDLEIQDNSKAIEIESLLKTIQEKEIRIDLLSVSITKIKNDLKHEKARINNLDSVGQFDLLRSNIDLFKRSGGEGD